MFNKNVTLCSQGDGRPTISGGLCGMHYARLRRLGTLTVTKIQSSGKIKECSEGDGRPVQSLGLCTMHYLRLRRHGSLEGRDRKQAMRITPPQFPLPPHGTREQWICWAAGFFDGEGCISIVKDKGNKHYFLTLAVSQVEMTSLQIFQALFGGNITTRHAPSDKTRRNCSHWRLSSQGARIVLEFLLPFLIVKKRQAELAIELCNDTANRWGPVTDEEIEKREHIKQAISRLNHGLPEIDFH